MASVVLGFLGWYLAVPLALIALTSWLVQLIATLRHLHQLTRRIPDEPFARSIELSAVSIAAAAVPTAICAMISPWLPSVACGALPMLLVLSSIYVPVLVGVDRRVAKVLEAKTQSAAVETQ